MKGHQKSSKNKNNVLLVSNERLLYIFITVQYTIVRYHGNNRISVRYNGGFLVSAQIWRMDYARSSVMMQRGDGYNARTSGASP